MIKIFSTNEVKQGSEKWLALRSNYISGTDAYDLLRGKTVTEILSNKVNNSFKGNFWTIRGHVLEDEAKEIYSEVFQPTLDVGFVINDKYPYCGVSPDSLVSDDGLVEVKAFNAKRHLDVFRRIDPHIVAQTQYQLFVTERAWCDLVLYNPDLDPEQAFLVKRQYPKKTIQDKFHEIFSTL